MTRGKTVKQFLWKSIVSAATAMLLVCIFKSACTKDGTLDYVWLWILCGLPFGLHRMCFWIIPGGKSFGGSIAATVFGFILSGVIGGFVLAWRVIIVLYYIPLTVCRLIKK